MDLVLDAIRRYLACRHARPVAIEEVRDLNGTVSDTDALKQFGYGTPMLVAYRAGNEQHVEVLHRVKPTPFGRERPDDRAAAIWFDYTAFNRLPRHVPAVDMAVAMEDGSLRSLAGAEELVLVTRFQPGSLYADDLMRLRDGAPLTPQDLARTAALAGYLAAIHSRRHDDPALWRRRLRDLVGHGEGIMGLTDSYPADCALAPPAFLAAWEEAANRWRWRLKPRSHRLCQVHGDFHPFNILFQAGAEFTVLDRSRGEWGEAADDVSCLTVNYLFFALQQQGRFTGALRMLYDRFWAVYLAARPDDELLEVIQPWFAWRILVLASPLWYPTIDDDVRRKLLVFGRRVMDADRFDYAAPEHYFEDAP